MGSMSDWLGEIVGKLRGSRRPLYRFDAFPADWNASEAFPFENKTPTSGLIRDKRRRGMVVGFWAYELSKLSKHMLSLYIELLEKPGNCRVVPNALNDIRADRFAIEAVGYSRSFSVGLMHSGDALATVTYAAWIGRTEAQFGGQLQYAGQKVRKS